MHLIWGGRKLLEPSKNSDKMHDKKESYFIKSYFIWDKYTHGHETFSLYRVNNNNLKRVFFAQEVVAGHTYGTCITIFYWDVKANRKNKDVAHIAGKQMNFLSGFFMAKFSRVLWS